MPALLGEKLKALECPYTDGIDKEASIRDILLGRPSSTRLRILKWLLLRVCPQLAPKLDSVTDVRGFCRDDHLEQKLVFLFSALGLCRPDDVDLIKGSCSRSRQEHFLHVLIDLAVTRYECCELTAHTTGDLVCRDWQLISSTAKHPTYPQMFSAKVDLLPPDIHHAVLHNWKLERGHQPYDRPPETDFARLREQLETLTEEVRKQRLVLADMDEHQNKDGSRRETHVALEGVDARCHSGASVLSGELSRLSVSGSPGRRLRRGAPPVGCASAALLKKLSLALVTLQQTVVNYNLFFDQSLSGWCVTPPEPSQTRTFSKIGPLVQRTSHVLRAFSSMVGQLTRSPACCQSMASHIGALESCQQQLQQRLNDICLSTTETC